MADLKGRSVRGGVLTVVGQAGQFFLQLISGALLARLLTPADFGLVAMVTSVSSLAKVVADGGLSWATVQTEEINHSQISTLFWVNFLIGLLLMLVVMVIGPALAWFYGDSRLTAIALAVSPTFVIGGLMAQHDALLKRQMRFKAIASRDLVSYAVGATTGLLLAWTGLKYWALVAVPIVMSLVQLSISWVLSGWVPDRPGDYKHVLSLLRFGRNLVGYNFLTQVTRSADLILVGWAWGPAPLGLYSRASNLMMLPWRQINAPLDGIAVSSLSRIEDAEHFARYYLRTVNLMMWFSAPIIGFLFVGAEPTILLLLGKQWLSAAEVFRAMSLAAIIHPVYFTATWLFISRGKTGSLLRLGVVTAPLIVASFAVGLPFGIVGVALSYSACLFFSLPFIFHTAFKGTNLSLNRLFMSLCWPIAVSLVAVGVGVEAMRALNPDTIISQLVTVFTSFLVVYLCALLIVPVRNELRAIALLTEELRFSRNMADSDDRHLTQ